MSIEHASGQDPITVRLAAQIAIDQPTLLSALRRSSERICQYAGRLEAELGTYRPLVGYLNDAVSRVAASTGQAVEEELLGCLLDRLGVTEVDLALDRVAEGRSHV
jgi:hypothetical protein